jgi:hypothetical protein
MNYSVLNDRQRSVVRLRDEDNLTFREIGVLLDITGAHASSIYRQSYRKLDAVEGDWSLPLNSAVVKKLKGIYPSKSIMFSEIRDAPAESYYWIRLHGFGADMAKALFESAGVEYSPSRVFRSPETSNATRVKVLRRFIGTLEGGVA